MEAVRLGMQVAFGGGQRKTVKKSAEIRRNTQAKTLPGEKSVHLFLGSTIVWRNYVFENRLHRRRQWFICFT